MFCLGFCFLDIQLFLVYCLVLFFLNREEGAEPPLLLFNKKRVTRCGHTLELVFNNLSLISEFLVQERGGGEATFFTFELSVETESCLETSIFFNFQLIPSLSINFFV